MASKKTEKRRAARLRKSAKAIQTSQDELEDENIPGDDSLEETEPEELQKDYMDSSYGGATSFEELDALKDANNKARAVRETTWETQDLVGNVLRDPEMSPEQKAKAIGNIGSGFSARVSKLVKVEKKEKKSYDMDVLEVQAILAKHKRRLSLVERTGEWLSKTRLHPEIEYPLSNKIEVIYSMEKFVKELTEHPESTVRESLVILKQAAEEMELVSLDERGSVLIEKDLDGQWRAIMVPSNKFQDLDGDILSSAAHEEYVQWVKQNPHMMPEVLLWHQPVTKHSHAVDFMAYDDGFLIASAILEEHEAAGLLKAQQSYDLGMSHGSFALETDPQNPKVITKYRMFEVSVLPIEKAANPFTDFDAVHIVKEARMKKETQDFIASIVGPEKAAALAAQSQAREKVLENAGIESKEKKTESPDTIVAAPADSKPVVDTPASVLTPELLKAIEEHLGVDGLDATIATLKEQAGKVGVLEDTVRELLTLKDGQDQKLADMISPTIAKQRSWMESRPSESDRNKLNKDTEEGKKILKSTPALDPENWLSQAVGAQPLDSVNS